MVSPDTATDEEKVLRVNKDTVRDSLDHRKPGLPIKSTEKRGKLGRSFSVQVYDLWHYRDQGPVVSLSLIAVGTDVTFYSSENPYRIPITDIVTEN